MKSTKKQLFTALVFSTTVGSIIVSDLAVFYFLGQYLEGILFVSPWGKIIGIFLGIIVAVFSIYMLLKRDYVDD